MDTYSKGKRVAIIQARMNSSRLPGKVLIDLGGQPMLQRVITRTRRAKLVDEVMVATTDDASDDPVEEFCRQQGVAVFRGSQFDVLDRFYQAARQCEADVIVRLTADCPLLDPQVVDHTLEEFFKSGADFAANRLPPPWKRTYPIGLDTEVCYFKGLERAWKEADQPHQREHVMPYFYDREGHFKVLLVNHDPDYGAERWTVDTPQDLELVRLIFAHYNNRDDFSWYDVLELKNLHPEWFAINAGIHHKTALDVDERANGK